MDYVEQYVEMCRFKNRRFALVDGQLFARKDRWIVPVGPASQPYRLDRGQCRELLRKLGGLWVMWTDGFGPHAEGSEWHAVICRRHTVVEEVASGNTRSKLRRGLKQCEVRPVEVKEIARNGYETYCAAVSGYGLHEEILPTAEEFARRVMTDEPFADIRHRWAAYHDGKMVAFAQNLIYEKTEVDYTLIKLHPKYLNRYSSYALIYRMNEHYLAQEGFEYVTDGFRSISHETGVQDFLMKEFGFEKARTGLHIHYRWPLGPLLRMARPFRGVLTKVYPKADALLELDRLGTRT
jgi:hypothetical protein